MGRRKPEKARTLEMFKHLRGINMFYFAGALRVLLPRAITKHWHFFIFALAWPDIAQQPKRSI